VANVLAPRRKPILRAAWLLLFGTAAVVLAACGSSGGNAATTNAGSPSHGASTTTSTAPVTAAQATQVANAINLKPADLPGYTTSPPDNSSGNDAASQQLQTCAGAAPQSAQVIDVSSDGFAQGSDVPQVNISSEVSVERTVADVHTDLTAIQSAKARQCIIRYFDQQLTQSAGSGVTISDATIAPIPVTAPGTDGSFGDALTATMTAQGVHISMTVDFEGFVIKNYEVELASLGLDESPSSSTNQRLLGLLANRATAAIP
jgi:hypothetical protein